MPRQILPAITYAWKLIYTGRLQLSRIVTAGFCFLSFLICLGPFLQRNRDNPIAWLLLMVRLVFLWTLYGMLNLEMTQRVAMAERIGHIGRSLTVTSTQAEQIVAGIKDKTLACEDGIEKLQELAQSLKLLAASL